MKHFIAVSGRWLCALLWAICAQGQTRVHLQTQGKNMDFSSMVQTKPAQTGAALPAACSIGEVYFRTDVAPGSNLYGCTAANTWTQLSGGGTGGDYTVGVGLSLIGSVLSGDFGVLPGLAASNVYSGMNDFSLGGLRIPGGTGVPSAAQCSSAANVGRVYARTDAKTGGATGYICSQVGTGVYGWEQMQGGAGIVLEDRVFPIGGCAGSSLAPSPGISLGSLATSCSPVAYVGLPATGSPAVTLQFQLPSTWTGAVDLRVAHFAADSGSGSVRYSIRTACMRNGSSVTPSYNSAQTMDSGVTLNTYSTALLSSLTATGCQAGDMMTISLSRDNTIGGNFSGAAALTSMTVAVRHQ